MTHFILRDLITVTTKGYEENSITMSAQQSESRSQKCQYKKGYLMSVKRSNTDITIDGMCRIHSDVREIKYSVKTESVFVLYSSFKPHIFWHMTSHHVQLC